MWIVALLFQKRHYDRTVNPPGNQCCNVHLDEFPAKIRKKTCDIFTFGKQKPFRPYVDIAKKKQLEILFLNVSPKGRVYSARHGVGLVFGLQTPL